ncbi:hypothetical protein ACFLZJ_01360 [Nanoarchaeota archaeon]
MTKQTLGKKLIEDFNPEEYKSFEQKYIGDPLNYLGKGIKKGSKKFYEDKLTPFGHGTRDFTKGLFKGAYAAVVTPFRFPTLFRKMGNDQEYAPYNIKSKQEEDGEIMGVILGVLADVACVYAVLSVDQESYLLQSAATTNVLSALYETARLKQTRAEKEILRRREKGRVYRARRKQAEELENEVKSNAM